MGRDCVPSGRRTHQGASVPSMPNHSVMHYHAGHAPMHCCASWLCCAAPLDISQVSCWIHGRASCCVRGHLSTPKRGASARACAGHGALDAAHVRTARGCRSG